MPIYEYECADCGHRLEAIQKLSEDPLTDCPTCGRAALKRLISAGGFRLKGSGWYATDYKNKGKKQDANKDKDKDKDKGEAPASEPGGGTPEKKAHSCGGGGRGCAH